MNQEQALAILKTGTNVFLTGSAGAGKTYVLNKYIDYLRERKIPVSITASTGIAATHIQGTTIHAWSGIGIKDALSVRQLNDMLSKKYLKKNLEKSVVLIIDEISMLHQVQFELVNQVLKYFRNSEEAFGGVQLVLCGDFFQLPPVGKRDESNRDKFCFMGPSWLEANLNICYLTEQYRQTDGPLNRVLNQIRSGVVDGESRMILEESAQRKSLKDPTKLYTHNMDVDRINQNHMDGLSGRKKEFKATIKGNLKLAETIKKSIMAPEVLRLKKDARVMFVKNNYEKGYLNGSLGTVKNFNSEGFPVIELDSGLQIVAKSEDWRIEDETGKLLVSYVQIPLRLAWAITVHKSQGMTLDAAEMDLSNTFEKGQGYVALSRVKDLEGLQLMGYNSMALEVDSLALKADLRFQQLSQELSLAVENKDLETLATGFIKDHGGILDKDQIKENKQRMARGEKPGKVSTYLKTKQLIDIGHDLEQIQKERDLTKGTLITHLLKIHELYPQTDLKRFKPEAAVMRKVKKARKEVLTKQGKQERVSLKPLFKELNGQLSYEDIKLALLYL